VVKISFNAAQLAELKKKATSENHSVSKMAFLLVLAGLS